MRCGYCWKRIHSQRNGAWYHDHNSSVACRPGEGTGRVAFPGGAQDWSRPSKAGAGDTVPGPRGEAGSPHDS